MALKEIRYIPSVTAEQFHACDDFVRGIRGPVGSGKSVAMCLEIFFRGCEQKADQFKFRRTRWAVVRNTYPELKSTTMRTWLDWFPEDPFGRLKWDAPITYHFLNTLPDKTKVAMEIIFLAIDRPDDVKKLLSMELTGAFINEAREIGKPVLDALTGRVGRYPSKSNGGPTWSGIIMDTNPPDDDHWWHDLAEVSKPEGYKFFRQPGAYLYNDQTKTYSKNPEAENVENHTLGYDYWWRQIPGKTHEWIKVYVLGEYGIAFDGKPVYQEFSETKHLTDTILPMRGLPLYLGWDFGLSPAVCVCQVAQNGQFRVLEEIIGEDEGLRQFIAGQVKPRLVNQYQGMRTISAFDPAGMSRSQSDERTCKDELLAAGFQCEPSISNAFLPRRSAVASFMSRSIGDSPAFLVSRTTCKHLVKGFLGGYQYERVQVAGEERYREQPKKDSYSHIQDALQYIALYIDSAGGGINIETQHQARPVVNSGRWL